MNQSPGIILPNGQDAICDYNEIKLDDNTTRRRAKLEMWIAQRLGQRLVLTYPGRNWSVEVDIEGGVAYVKCTDLTTDKGYTLHLDASMQELQSQVINAGGEILERFGISREKKFDAAAIDEMVRDLRGNAVSNDG